MSEAFITTVAELTKSPGSSDRLYLKDGPPASSLPLPDPQTHGPESRPERLSPAAAGGQLKQ